MDTEIYIDIWISEHTDGHMDIQTSTPPSIYLPKKPNPNATPNTHESLPI